MERELGTWRWICGVGLHSVMEGVCPHTVPCPHLLLAHSQQLHFLSSVSASVIETDCLRTAGSEKAQLNSLTLQKAHGQRGWKKTTTRHALEHADMFGGDALINNEGS
ncbi:unnamed protein product [Pleuronectes platessa]|uniref:Uncharacterized protein n=1 Tax=Pleuronectes platessa TaxID=8262 RepID=A0A9N7TS59_PLEPL|nr:unnamed protein product [Pleuronectes platessa]